MGDGPNYMLLRPFHLCSMEIPLSVAQAVVQHRATMYPRPRLTAEVMTIAKRDLSEGEVLDRIGGGTHYGMIDRADVAEEMGALPLGLAMGSIMVQGVKKGDPICFADIELPTDSTVVTLRKLQDAWTKGDIAGPDLLQELNRIVAQDT